jgi:hypothetical protein
MNRKTAKCIIANIDIVRAFADGKQIQWKFTDYQGNFLGWEDCEEKIIPEYLEPGRYRIKPDEEVCHEKYLCPFMRNLCVESPIILKRKPRKRRK